MEFVTVLLLFYIWGIFGPEAHGILVPWPGMKHKTPALGEAVLTSDPLGTAPNVAFF